MDGIVTIVQEGRFQLTDDAGVSHLCILDRNAAAEPAQLAPLQRRQARVRVHYTEPHDLIGLAVASIALV
jgi:hypothetical protein